MFILDRILLELKGPDVFDFLQGILTINVYDLNSVGFKFGLILSPQGKYKNDIFLFMRKSGTILMDCGGSSEILNDLKKYKLGYNIKIRDISSNFYLCFSKDKISSEDSFQDLRPDFIGWRSLLKKENDYNFSNHSDYLKFRIDNNIIDCSSDMIINKSYPLEYGLDYSIDFDKGCYIGQEVTTRINLRGEIRKKVYKVTIIDQNKDVIPFYSDVIYNGKKIGKMLSNIDGSGLILGKTSIINNIRDDINIYCEGKKLCFV